MPHVPGQSKVTRRSYHTDKDIDKTMRPAKPRDNLREAFAGDENRGPAGKGTKNQLRSTNVKSRRTAASATKTPKR